MNNRFNLINDPWIPVENEGLHGLMDVLTNTSFTKLHCMVLDKISILKLLLAIGQSAFTPKDDEEWLGVGLYGFIEKVRDYLIGFSDKFYLYGDEPFLQYTCLDKLIKEKKSFGNFIPSIAVGNTSVVTQWQVERTLSDAEKAQLLIRQMAMAFSGKKVDNSVTLTPGYKEKSKSGKAGPGVGSYGLLHSFYTGDSIAETVYFNLLTQKDLENLPMFRQGIGVAPWEKMPAGEDDEIARNLKSSLMGRLVSLSRFCYLYEDGIKVTEGLIHLNYKDGVYDPSVCVIDGGKEPKALWSDAEKKPWRQLEALLGFLGSSSVNGCMQLKLPAERIKRLNKCFGVWAGGLQLSSNSGEQYLTGTDDEVQSEILLPEPACQGEFWFTKFCNVVTKLNDMATSLKISVRRYLDEFSEQNDGILKQVTLDFWQHAEKFSQELVTNCYTENMEEVQKIIKKCAGFSRDIYDKHCPSNTPKQMKAWAKHRFNGSTPEKNNGKQQQQ